MRESLIVLPRLELEPERVDQIRSKDGRHELLSYDNGVRLYVEIEDGKIKSYDAVDAAGKPVAGATLRLDVVTDPFPVPPFPACMRCMEFLGTWICVWVPCPEVRALI